MHNKLGDEIHKAGEKVKPPQDEVVEKIKRAVQNTSPKDNKQSNKNEHFIPHHSKINALRQKEIQNAGSVQWRDGNEVKNSQ